MSGKETRVFIRNLELLARIGVHGHEQGTPQPVRFNVWLSCEANGAGDRLENAIDYETVADKIRAIVASGHINLAETLAERVAAACLEDPRVKKVEVSVDKLHALHGAESAGVEIERERTE